ncbi:MAG: type 1 periplasmic binding fold superfamily protein [Myxococcota bacterium]|nr:type 1 periplasmic binding fold superfamily protein [Myxococcota bacterium]
MRAAILMLLVGCSDDIATINSGEVITTVVLTFTPTSGPEVVVLANDPDGDGGEAPTIDPIMLAPDTYALAVGFQNRLEDPPEEITEEVADEGDDHQVFFTGSAASGPLMHEYVDFDRNGLPIGLQNRVVAVPGTGMLTLTLRHMPPINDMAVKTGQLADQARAMGTASLPGESDAVVTFPASVQ